MARAASTNSAASDWFFNLADNTNLDAPPGYTVFGRTLRGTNILNRFNNPGAASKLYTSSDPIIPQPAGSFIPVYSTNGQTGFWVNLDITLLTVEISRVRASNVISWNSVENLPNIVEYTTVVPAVWQTFQTVTGTGAQMSVSDPSADAMRHYRVRVVYPN